MTTDASPLIFLMGVTGQTGRLILEDFDRHPPLHRDAGNYREANSTDAESCLPANLRLLADKRAGLSASVPLGQHGGLSALPGELAECAIFCARQPVSGMPHA